MDLRFAFLVMMLFQTIASFAQIDTLDFSKGDLITSNLKPGLHQYLVYGESPKKKKILGLSLWNRQVNFKKLNGKDVIEIVQNWSNTDTLYNRYVYSICDRKNFAPIYHYTKNSKAIDAFDFSARSLDGSDSVKDNAVKDFTLALTEPTLNWELDLETFSTFPIKKEGQRFIVNFYHPGGKGGPQYYEYKIIGSEKIQGSDDRMIDCWQMKIDYREDSWAIFWISKKSKEVMKMQEYYRGNYRYKIRMATPVPMTKA